MFKLKYLKSSIKNALLLIAVFYGFDGVVLSNAESGFVGIITYVSSVIIGVALSLIYVDRLWFTFKKHELWAALVPTFILITGMAVTGFLAPLVSLDRFSHSGYINGLALALSFLTNCQLITGLRKKDMLQS